jgi:hypothetical protein
VDMDGTCHAASMIAGRRDPFKVVRGQGHRHRRLLLFSPLITTTPLVFIL